MLDDARDDIWRRLDQERSRISDFLFGGYQSLFTAAVQASVKFKRITDKDVESGVQETFLNALYRIVKIAAPELGLIAGAAKIAKTANAKGAAEAAELAEDASTAIQAARVAMEAAKLAQETKDGVAEAQENFKKDIEANKGVTKLLFNSINVSDGIAAEEPNLREAENMAEVRTILKMLDDARAVALVPLTAAGILLDQKNWFEASGAIQKLLDGIQMPGKRLTGEALFNARLTPIFSCMTC